MLALLLALTDEEYRGKIQELFDKYHERMLRLSIGMLESAGFPNAYHDAEDAVQNAFYKISKNISLIDFDRCESDIRAYVLTIAVNETKNSIRKKQRIVATEAKFVNNLKTNDEDDDFFEQLSIKERYNEVVRAIGKLDEKYRTALFMRYVEEMSALDIAEILGVSRDTVYTRIDRGRKMLLKILEEEGEQQ